MMGLIGLCLYIFVPWSRVFGDPHGVPAACSWVACSCDSTNHVATLSAQHLCSSLSCLVDCEFCEHLHSSLHRNITHTYYTDVLPALSPGNVPLSEAERAFAQTRAQAEHSIAVNHEVCKVAPYLSLTHWTDRFDNCENSLAMAMSFNQSMPLNASRWEREALSSKLQEARVYCSSVANHTLHMQPRVITAHEEVNDIEPTMLVEAHITSPSQQSVAEAEAEDETEAAEEEETEAADEEAEAEAEDQELHARQFLHHAALLADKMRFVSQQFMGIAVNSTHRGSSLWEIKTSLDALLQPEGPFHQTVTALKATYHDAYNMRKTYDDSWLCWGCGTPPTDLQVQALERIKDYAETLQPRMFALQECFQNPSAGGHLRLSCPVDFTFQQISSFRASWKTHTCRFCREGLAIARHMDIDRQHFEFHVPSICTTTVQDSTSIQEVSLHPSGGVSSNGGIYFSLAVIFWFSVQLFRSKRDSKHHQDARTPLLESV